MIEVFNIKQGLFLGILNLKTFAESKKLQNKREIETQGKLFLADYLLDYCTIEYDDKGKPYLKNDTRHISLTHSHDKLALIVNEMEATGIDIELIRNKVLNIRHKFLSEKDLSEAGNDPEKLLIYWAAKETLYKIYGLKEVDFIKHLFIEPFVKNLSGTIIGHIHLENFHASYELNYKLIDNYVLVYALKKI